FAWVVSARALRPVSELMEGADRVANGDLNHEVPVRSTDEVGRLAHSFNDMAGQLHQSFDKLEVQNQELKRLDKLKDEFLANTSHELRTPLNGIIGLAESIIDGATGPLNSETEKNLSMVVSSGKRLESLVNDILDFSKLKNQAIELQRKPIDVYTMSELALTLSKALVGNKDLLLVNRVTPDAPLVLADENRIQQILLNLVGNAIKFTDAGEVSISASDEGDYLSVSISDTGIGIPEGQTERIFESFLQADGATAREYGGTGLGLTVTRQLVELHGGSIGVTSEEGLGSCFTFTLPVADPELRLEVGRQVSTIRIQPETLNTAPESPVKSDELFMSKTTGADGKQHRVMIVDDEPVNLQVLANHLSLQNYSITHAQSGQEALDLLDREARFDVVLLDVMMPRMSGYEVCQKIRETYSPHELPVLMLTAKNQVPDLLNGFDAGANDYIAKPFSKEELLARLSTHIQLTKTTQSFGRFVPLEYLNYLDKDSIIDVDLGDHISKEMTVMFSDLRGFTAISEQMTQMLTQSQFTLE
ncbi:MAG: ATP-binding protein, partial [Gammaproteobacteria bacterium]